MTTVKRGRPKRRWVRLWMAALAVGGVVLWWNWYNLKPSAISRSIAAYKRGDWSEADRLAQEYLRIAKHHPEALRLLARSSTRLGRFRRRRRFIVVSTLKPWRPRTISSSA